MTEPETIESRLFKASGQAHQAIDLLQKLGQAMATGSDPEVTDSPAGLDNVLNDIARQLDAAAATVRDAAYAAYRL